MAAERTITEVHGTIAAANDRGVKLAGGNQWINLSKWAAVEAIPPAGSAVVLGLDRSGYIREITATASAPQQVHQNAQESAPNCPPSRDSQIARMNALGHAVTLLTVRCGAPDVDDVLALAERLERWVLR